MINININHGIATIEGTFPHDLLSQLSYRETVFKNYNGLLRREQEGVRLYAQTAEQRALIPVGCVPRIVNWLRDPKAPQCLSTTTAISGPA